MFKLITVATGQAMREIDLNSLYVLPPYHAYDQSAHPKRSRSVGMQLMKLFFFFGWVGVWQRTSLVRSFGGIHRVRFTNHRKKIIMCFLAVKSDGSSMCGWLSS